MQSRSTAQFDSAMRSLFCPICGLSLFFFVSLGRVQFARSGKIPLQELVEAAPLPANYNGTLSSSLIDPEEIPGLMEGDIALSAAHQALWRVGLRWDVFPGRLWPRRTVPYAVSDLYGPEERATVLQAVRTLDFMTCIRFTPWDGAQKDYLLIWPIKYPQGCWSFVGHQGGAQIVSLQAPDERGPNCLGTEGRAVHELMHALGVFHEQSRADRDRFVRVHKDNILPGFLLNFDKQSLENTTYTHEYDYNSIMHYGRFFFSKGKGKPTLSARMSGGVFGQRRAMSRTDCLELNELYGCMKRPSRARKYQHICRLMGI